MTSNPILLAVPAFLVAMLLEGVAARRTYRLADTLSNLGCGLIQQAVEIATKGAVVAGYAAAVEALGLLRWDSSEPPAWIAGLLLADVAYYGWHRTSHEVAFLWATHVVHHQSREYNLSVALRQSAIAKLTSLPFYLPMILLGIPVPVFLGSTAIVTLYQFWIHTETIDGLGWFDRIFNSPSNHRVHHGVEPHYLDKNHGGILILWDRLFGTYQAELARPTYGTVAPFTSWDPVWANLDGWVKLLRQAARRRGWVERARVFLRPPGWEEPAEPAGAHANSRFA